MQNKNIYLLIVILVAFGGYFLYNSNEKQVAFEKNLKCSQYLEQEKETWTQHIEYGFVSGLELHYSPTLKTCVSTYTVTNYDDGFHGFYINNALTGEQIFAESGDRDTYTESGMTMWNWAEQEYNRKIIELGIE